MAAKPSPAQAKEARLHRAAPNMLALLREAAESVTLLASRLSDPCVERSLLRRIREQIAAIDTPPADDGDATC